MKGLQNLFNLRVRALATTTAEKREWLRDWSLVNAITNEIITRITAGEGAGLRWVLWVERPLAPNSWGHEYYDLFRLTQGEDVVMSVPAPILAPDVRDLLLALEPIVVSRNRAIVALAGARSYNELMERDEDEVEVQTPTPKVENVLDLWEELLPFITDRSFSSLSSHEAERAKKKLDKMERKLHHRALLQIAA